MLGRNLEMALYVPSDILVPRIILRYSWQEQGRRSAARAMPGTHSEGTGTETGFVAGTAASIVAGRAAASLALLTEWQEATRVSGAAQILQLPQAGTE